MFNHNNDSTTAACGLTTDNLLAAIKKLHNEASNEPFAPYTAEDRRALLLLAVNTDPSLLANTLNFVDESVFKSIDSKSKLIEALEKYPPTFEQIIAVMAVREFNNTVSSN